MRVRLSYTVEDEDVLAETAKIINLSATDLQLAIGLFTGIQTELAGGPEKEDEPNIHKCFEIIEEFRKFLLNVDTRMGEAEEIIKGYDNYRRDQRNAAAPPPEETE